MPHATNGKAAVGAPICLTESLGPGDQAVVHAWWASLSDEDREAMCSLLNHGSAMRTFPFELKDIVAVSRATLRAYSSFELGCAVRLDQPMREQQFPVSEEPL